MHRLHTMPVRVTGTIIAVCAAIGAAVLLRPAIPDVSQASAPASVLAQSPIKHVVVIYQENHSFDNVLGKLCVADQRCDGAISGKLKTGQTIALTRAADIIPQVEHSSASHRRSIDGGKMDGFSLSQGCREADNYRCYSQYDPSQIPNLAALARTFVISDRTFETGGPSFGGHIGVVSPNLDGFTGDNPAIKAGQGPGWGCDSHRDALWRSSPGAQTMMVPACIPTESGAGPYRSSPVSWAPNLLGRLDSADLDWRIYGPTLSYGTNAYGWAICPTFADCLLGPTHTNQVPRPNALTDARAGTLPPFSIVIPTGGVSQHNLSSMIKGDNWIGQVVSAIENGPDWDSTVIFITYDDCGCFYDHVAPPSGLGIRIPMVIVSPYAKPGFTDSHTAGLPSMMAFTEHLFGLAPMGTEDANAYDYADAFDFTQTPLAPVRMTTTPVPRWEQRWLAAHPFRPDAT
jgi:phospholipase C